MMDHALIIRGPRSRRSPGAPVRSSPSILPCFFPPLAPTGVPQVYVIRVAVERKKEEEKKSSPKASRQCDREKFPSLLGYREEGNLMTEGPGLISERN